MERGLKKIAAEMIREALHTVDPFQLIKEQIRLSNQILTIQKGASIDLSVFQNIYLTGAGKGAASMAAALEDMLGSLLREGAIIVKYRHGKSLKKIRVFESGHPLPDENTLINTKQLLDLVDKAKENDLVIVVLTGGGSALMELLPTGINLQHLTTLNHCLLSSGATIQEINTIRKHISLIKGGRLAKRIAPAKTLTLILSDVIADSLESIASGPTVADSTTFKQSLDIIEKYSLESKIPTPIVKHLKKGLQNFIEETPKPNDPVFNLTRNFVIGNNALALKKMAEVAQDYGFKTLLLTDQVQGEAREIAKMLAGIIKSSLQSHYPIPSPGCLILGGEPTVTMRGKGKGGRNQELTLAMLEALKEVKSEFYFCSVGSDGTDGPTDAAGAWIDQNTIKKVIEKGLSIRAFLEANDSYHFFKDLDQLVITGPTKTNVMDLIFCLY